MNNYFQQTLSLTLNNETESQEIVLFQTKLIEFFWKIPYAFSNFPIGP